MVIIIIIIKVVKTKRQYLYINQTALNWSQC